MASKRQYTTQTEVQEVANIVISDTTEADDIISQAEELIDTYVGFQNKHIKENYYGQATSGTTTTLIDTSGDSSFLVSDDNFFLFCQVEIVAGTNKGELRNIISSVGTTQTITVDTAFTSAIDSTSVYLIRQLGKFPRTKDTFQIGSIYYKTIPEAVKRAVAMQVQYMIEKGDKYFASAVDNDSEGIGEYSYTSRENINKLIAPKARQLLDGIMVRIGQYDDAVVQGELK